MSSKIKTVGERLNARSAVVVLRIASSSCSIIDDNDVVSSYNPTPKKAAPKCNHHSHTSPSPSSNMFSQSTPTKARSLNGVAKKKAVLPKTLPPLNRSSYIPRVEVPPPPPEANDCVTRLPSILPEDVFTVSDFCVDPVINTIQEITRIEDLPSHKRTLPTADPPAMVSLLFRLALLRGNATVKRLSDVPKDKLRAALAQQWTVSGRLTKGGWMRAAESVLPDRSLWDKHSAGKMFDAFVKGSHTDIDGIAFSHYVGIVLGYHEPYATLAMCMTLFDPQSRAPRYCTRLEMETMVRVYREEVSFICTNNVGPKEQQELHRRCADALEAAGSKVYFDLKGRVDINEFLSYIRENDELSVFVFNPLPDPSPPGSVKKQVVMISPGPDAPLTPTTTSDLPPAPTPVGLV